MALVMRLRKLGSRGQPHFRIAVADSTKGRDGPFVEEIGWYDPKKPGENSKLDEERARYWLAKGAKPSDTVRSLLKKHNVFGTRPQPEAPPPAPEPTEPTEPAPEPTEAAAEEAEPPEPKTEIEEPEAETPKPAAEPEAPAPEATEPPPEPTE